MQVEYNSENMPICPSCNNTMYYADSEDDDRDTETMGEYQKNLKSKTFAELMFIQDCLYAPDQGFDEYYKYDVFLKAGHVFTNGKYFGLRGARFVNVKEFREACPMAIDKMPEEWYNCPVRNAYGNSILHE